MQTQIEDTLIDHSGPRLLRRCSLCQGETPHEIRSAAGLSVTVCLPCLERALNYELDRD
jgi:hypothetical protein